MKKLTLKDSMENEIHIFLYEPKTKPKAILHIIHGASEHFARYGLFAEYMNQHGFLVIGSDILGHGLSTKTTDHVHFADKDGERIAFESVLLVTDHIMAKYPELPHYVLGHSMGEFLARKVLIDRPEVYEKAVWSGSTYVLPLVSFMGRGLANMISALKGPRYVSRLILDMAIDANPKKMRKRGMIKELDEEWLTHDRLIQDYYHNSPLCGQPFTVKANADMFKWINTVNKVKNLQKIRKDLPILIASGKEDPLSDFGKKIDSLKKIIARAGLVNVRFNTYPEMRHEILNELDKAKVWEDIRLFLEE